MRWFWGILIIVIGILILGQNFSWWNNINFIQYWPLLLIIFGIALMVKNLSYGPIIIILSFLLAIGLIVSGVLPKTIKNTSVSVANTFFADLPNGVDKGGLNVETGAVKLNIDSGTDKFIEGSLESSIFEPSLITSQNGNTISADLKTTTKEDWLNWSRGKNNLDIKLTDKVPVDLSINAGASDIQMDLEKIKLSSLILKSGASSIDLKIGDNVESDANLSIKAGASNIKISVPKDLGVKATITSGLSSKDLSGFNKLSDSNYESDNYSTASKKINLSIDAGVSSIEITRT